MFAKDEKGSMLVLVLLVLALMISLGFSLYALIYSRSQEVRLNEYRVKASYLSEAGITLAVAEFVDDADYDGSGSINIGEIAITELPIGSGNTYQAEHDKDAGIILGKGTAESINKEIEVSYKR